VPSRTPSHDPIDRAVYDPTVIASAVWGAGRTRLRSVDVMRGAVLALMILTPPIRYAGTYPMLGHAEWIGWSLSDLVFPLFLFVSGLSLAFLLREPVNSVTKRRLVRRLFALLIIGVVYNAIGQPIDISSLRFTGVLQLIGISGAVATVAILTTRRPDGSDRLGLLAAVASGLLLAYGAVLVWLPGSCGRFAAGCNPFFTVDTTIIGRSHLYRPFGDISYDPEGLIVSVAAAALVLSGYLAARVMSTLSPGRAVLLLGTLGTAGLGTALLVNQWLPISKRLFTPSFAVLAASIGTLLFVGFVVLFDIGHDDGLAARAQPLRRIAAWPFVVLGANALVVFLSERIILQVADNTTIGERSAGRWLLERIGTTPSTALVLSTALLAVIFGITAFMRWRGWRIVL
jgi:heparan-alpha-glucosaminide N-acetyltransferase